MDKKFQVFLSSPYLDLIEARSKAVHALLQMDCIPSGMELFPAGNNSQLETIKKIIQNCDYYVLILAGRYGSVDSTGISYTEQEYRFAESCGIPVAAFLYKDIDNLPGKNIENTPDGKEKLLEFREYVQNRFCKYWEDPADLSGIISTSMYHLMKENPREGWIRLSRKMYDANFHRTRIERIESILEVAMRAIPLIKPKSNGLIRCLVTMANPEKTLRRTVCGINIRMDPEHKIGVPFDFGVAGKAIQTGLYTKADLPADHHRGYPDNVRGLIWEKLKSVVAEPLKTESGEIIGTINFDSTCTLKQTPLGLPEFEKIVKSLARSIEPIVSELFKGQQ